MVSMVYHERYGQAQSFESIYPSETQIREAIFGMNNRTRTHVKFYGKRGQLSISGGNRGRVSVAYSDVALGESTFQFGILTDPLYLESQERVDIVINDESTAELLRRTVSKDVAMEAAIHYVRYERFPMHLTWEGRMEEMTHK